jgi:hypothetical protein
MIRKGFRWAGALGALAIAAWGFAESARAAGGALDGKTFIAESGEQGKKAEGPKDEISFRDGKMHSSACDPYGFGDGAYTTMNHPGAVMFHARTESPKEGSSNGTAPSGAKPSRARMCRPRRARNRSRTG